MNDNIILPSQWIRQALDSGFIHADIPPAQKQIQPNSLDLRIGDRVDVVKCSFLPGSDGVAKKLKGYSTRSAQAVTASGFTLFPNEIYVFRALEGLTLPPHIGGRANPKSSTGRLDVFARVVTENGVCFDEIPPGYDGALYIQIVSRSFPIVVRPGDSFVQVRFQSGNPAVLDNELAAILSQNDILMSAAGRALRPADLKIAGGAFLSPNLTPDSAGIVGYRARQDTGPVDFGAVGAHRVSEFWTPIPSASTGTLVLEPDAFYIFRSKEFVSMPPAFCAELIPFDPASGEFRAHYAGFFDSGFGFHEAQPASETASAIVFEIRARDVPFLLEEAHPLFRMVLMRNCAPPDLLYGVTLNSNYQGQRLKLAKQFASPGNCGGTEREIGT